MPLYRETSSGFVQWAGEAIDGIQHPAWRHYEAAWTAADLAAIGLFVPAPADPIPEGKISTGQTVQRIDGVVKFVHTLADAPPVYQPPSTPELYAAAQLLVQDGDVSGIGINSRFAGAFWGDVGKYYVFFGEPQPDTDYMVMASAGPWRAYVLTSDKTEDMFVVTVVDTAGEPADAEAVNIQILRAS